MKLMPVSCSGLPSGWKGALPRPSSEWGPLDPTSSPTFPAIYSDSSQSERASSYFSLERTALTAVIGADGTWLLGGEGWVKASLQNLQRGLMHCGCCLKSCLQPAVGSCSWDKAGLVWSLWHWGLNDWECAPCHVPSAWPVLPQKCGQAAALALR